ncbi:unnamed protein product [Prorocentrum cordatum]|uniref:Uncharacterized protein n=1 Tax=Prorocentrum cordatum TaxID=2364126 RepID=A0ABN9Q194_9DINO|nr:unnamed protein product [Polarella glacialis]
MEKNPQRVMAVAQESGAPAAGASAPRRAATSTPVSCSSGSPTLRRRCWRAGSTAPHGVRAPSVRASSWSPHRRGWPFKKPPCRGCACIARGKTQWSYDQVGFFGSVVTNETMKDRVTVFHAGCPINSPFADFIPHLVSGSNAVPQSLRQRIRPDRRGREPAGLRRQVDGSRAGHWQPLRALLPLRCAPGGRPPPRRLEHVVPRGRARPRGGALSGARRGRCNILSGHLSREGALPMLRPASLRRPCA